MVEEKLEQRVRCLKILEKLKDNFYDRLLQILDTGMSIFCDKYRFEASELIFERKFPLAA